MGDPEDMARIKVYDAGSVAMAVMKLELVYGEYPCGLLRPDQLRAVNGIQLFQALQVDIFDRVLAKSCDLGDLLERIGAKREEITGKKSDCPIFLISSEKISQNLTRE